MKRYQLHAGAIVTVHGVPFVVRGSVLLESDAHGAAQIDWPHWLVPAHEPDSIARLGVRKGHDSADGAD